MTTNDNTASDHLIPLSEVKGIAGLSKAMIYRLIRAGKFPKPFKPGGVSSRWSHQEVRAWYEARRAERDAA